MLDAGAYSDHKVDLNLASHPGPNGDSALVRTTAYTRFKVEYFGKEAHAAAAPWEGINALDALSKFLVTRTLLSSSRFSAFLIVHGFLAYFRIK